MLSFNGNKIITSGGGGCILTNNEEFAKKAKHITTTAKVPHKWDYTHDIVGYNYRIPNLNAALLVAQLEQINIFIFCLTNLITPSAMILQIMITYHYQRTCDHYKRK